MLGYQNIANCYFLCAGKSKGNTELTSFDSALKLLAYASLSSNKPDQVISSAVAIAIPNDRSIAGVIMEFFDFASLTEVKKLLKPWPKKP